MVQLVRCVERQGAGLGRLVVAAFRPAIGIDLENGIRHNGPRRIGLLQREGPLLCIRIRHIEDAACAFDIELRRCGIFSVRALHFSVCRDGERVDDRIVVFVRVGEIPGRYVIRILAVHINACRQSLQNNFAFSCRHEPLSRILPGRVALLRDVESFKRADDPAVRIDLPQDDFVRRVRRFKRVRRTLLCRFRCRERDRKVPDITCRCFGFDDPVLRGCVVGHDFAEHIGLRRLVIGCGIHRGH